MPRQNPDLLLQAREYFQTNVFPGHTREIERLRRASGRSPYLTKSFALTFLCGALWFSVALAGLWQWSSPVPWSQLDRYSGGILLLLLIWSLSTAYFHREMFQSREVMLEASGINFDRLMFFWIDIFAAAEVLVFFDYGHWHVAPILRQPFLQVPGLLLCVAGTAWLVWTDSYLSRQFRGSLTHRRMLDCGPYRLVRHPRYAGLIICGVAFALAMGSAVAWALAIGWIWVNVARVRLEDQHLCKLFGAEYEQYAAKTARFIPGIY